MSKNDSDKTRVFVRDLLFLDVIESTSPSEPKNSKEINIELERRWHELFPDVPFPKMGLKTIINHIADMKQSGLYDIKVHPNNRRGYYNAANENKVEEENPVKEIIKVDEEKIFFNTAEAIIIASALYRSPSISTEILEKIMDSLASSVEVEGSSYLYFLNRHINRWGMPRKTERDISPAISVIWNNLMDNRIPKKIKFRYHKAKYVVSPYFFAWENDEMYLIASVDGHYLHHFKMSTIEDLELVDESATPIRDMEEYKDYVPNIDFSKRDRGGLTIDFPLERYLREHVYMSCGDTLPIEIVIHFRNELKDIIITRFGTELDICEDDDDYFKTTITAQENDGLYQWLMQFGDKIRVISPDNVREKLKQRLLDALKLLE